MPPEGVRPLAQQQVDAVLAGQEFYPAHELNTRYRYTSLNALTWVISPDAGVAQTWYDDKTQQRLSQSAQQASEGKYGYSRYDNLGRLVETGEIYTSLALGVLLDSIKTNQFPSAAYWAMVPRLERHVFLSDITRTHYDLPAEPNRHTRGFEQTYLRTRVAWTQVLDKNATDTIATYYSYDAHGNVKSLLQQLPGLKSKRIDYAYDLITGKVNYVFYQYGQHDQFIHRYEYDADNFLTDVHTSTDGYLWNHDAAYFYYLHGPLARVELGHFRVQGLDYVYTLQGWLKGVNMPVRGDPGADGEYGSRVARDAFAFTLGYYKGDYRPVADSMMADARDNLWQRHTELNAHHGLYNGNISWMATDLPALKSNRYEAMVYSYDQLNRITASRSLTAYNASTGFAPRSLATPGPYDEAFTYDSNGNILSLKRYDGAANMLHNFNYEYYAHTNRLKEVNAVTRDTTYTGTINPTAKIYRNITAQGQATVARHAPVKLEATERIYLKTNFKGATGSQFHGKISGEQDGTYRYDANGNLVADMEQGTRVTWTPYGKLREVRTRNDSTLTAYRYDAPGNRIESRTVHLDSLVITRYVRDASGNVMAIYKDTTVLERPIYGSSRLGDFRGKTRSGHTVLGNRNYELSNHLGNVLVTITDNVVMTEDSVKALVTSTTDYYAFGLEKQERYWLDKQHARSRLAFNGKERDISSGHTKYDYGFRIYDPRLGKFLSVDPLAQSYPWYTPYQFAGNSPISGIDLDGLEYVLRIFSPNLSEKFNKAVEAGDIYEQRRITNYALNNSFPDDWVIRGSKDVGSPPGNKAATLNKNENVNGVQVITYGYYNGTNKITPLKSEVWEPSSDAPTPDTYYPVDVQEKSFYDTYGDFVASYRAGSAIQGYGGSAALIQGYLRGWGYVEYAATGKGYGDDAGASVGSMFGRYQHDLSEMTPITLTGKDFQYGISIRNFGYGKWEVYSNDAATDVAWKGDYYSMGMSFTLRKFIKFLNLNKTADVGGSVQTTNTTLVFPKPPNKP